MQKHLQYDVVGLVARAATQYRKGNVNWVTFGAAKRRQKAGVVRDFHRSDLALDGRTQLVESLSRQSTASNITPWNVPLGTVVGNQGLEAVREIHDP